MRFKVAKRDLEDALQVVGASISSSGSDISAHFTFRRTGPDKDDKYGVEVLTHAGRTFASCPMIVAVEDIGGKTAAFTVEGWRLKQWLQFVPDDSVPEFTLVDGEVAVRVRRGSQTFQSLDPSNFPYWDKVLLEAQKKATVPADRLAAALAYSKLFISDKESSEPEKCVTEVKNGILYSSDKKGVSLTRIPGMAESGLRVHGKDVGSFLTFLGTVGDGEVDVLEHDRLTILRRCVDGAMFGESRFHFAFPIPKVGMDDTDQHTWDIPRGELQQTIGFLVAGAPKEDNRLRIAPGEKAGDVVISMGNATGKTTSVTVSGVSMATAPSAPDIPETGFALDHLVLARVLNSWKSDTLRFGLNVQGDRGFVRFVYEQYESKYLTILAWLR